MKTRTAYNLIAGMGASLWSTIINLAAVPFYLHYLGIQSYAVIGFFVTYQTALLVLDLGLAPAITRQVAGLAAAEDLARIRSLLKTMGVVYWTLGGLIGVSTFFAAPLIGNHWLKGNNVDPETIVVSAKLMGLVTALRWPVGLYVGTLQGLHRVGAANLSVTLATSLTTVAAILVIALWLPSLPAFFVVQVIGAMGQVLLLWGLTRKALGSGPATHFDFGVIRQLWRFSAGMTAITISNVIFTQLDKIILSRIVPLSQFGVYVLAGSMVALLYRLTMPVYQTFVPRFAALFAAGDTAAIGNLYSRGTFLLTAALFPMALGLVLAGEPLVRLWTGDAALARATWPIVAILAVGSALDGAMTFPAAVQVGAGNTRLPLLANGWSLALQIPVTIVLTAWLGLIGGALSWLALHLFHFALGAQLTNRLLVPHRQGRWFARDVGTPAIVTAAVGFAGYLILARLALGPVAHIALAAAFCVATCGILAILSPYTRRSLREVFA